MQQVIVAFFIYRHYYTVSPSSIPLSFHIRLIGFIIVAITSCKPSVEKKTQPEPIAEKIPFVIMEHEHKRIDLYYWMRLSEEQKAAEQKDEQTEKVFQYLEKENAYLKGHLQHTEALQKKLYSEIIGRIKQKDESVPYKDNGYWYYVRYEEGQEYPIYCRKKEHLGNGEEILLNVNQMAEGHDYYQVSGISVSEDNRFLAFGLDTVSRRQYDIYFKDLVTGNLLSSIIALTEGDVTWANDNQHVFYCKKDETTLRSDRVFRHRVGSDPTTDQIVFHEKDETFSVGVYKTKSKKFLVIASGSTLSNYYKVLEADKPIDSFREFSPRERGHEYSLEHGGSSFFMVSNWQAKNFRLMETSESKTDKYDWKERIPHRNDVLLEGIELFKEYIALSERSNANTHMRLIDWKTGDSHYLDFGEPAYTVYPSANMEYDSEVIRYGYTSLKTPKSTFDYNMRTKEKTLLKQQEVVGGYEIEQYETKREWAKDKDGTLVPISIVSKKGSSEGKSPLLLYAYGSYGISMDPTFSSTRLSLLDRGFVFAIAHIRGGQEMGRHWYESGRMFQKMNTFTDYIACAEHLIEQKYTSPSHLYGQGGSAGGLLMGAVVNMRPDLFHGIIAQVPFVDVVSTMLDESIPLTTGEFDEWGNPKNKDSYEYMLTYSPYDNIKPQAYPNMLVTTGLHDSQVQYWEPAKWVAKIRELKTDDNLLLLRTNMETGHGGTTGRFKVYQEVAEEYAFLLDLEGKTE